MNPILRQRIPPSVRRLLTDIGPRNEWTERETETVTLDGIELPARGTTDSKDLLKPAADKEDGGSCTDAAAQCKICRLCYSKPSCYTCPRCNVPYCGLDCYRSTSHSVCSEEFYKESVFLELKDMGETESEGRKKMQDILLRLKRKADREEGGMESVLKDFEEEMRSEEETKARAQVLELLSRLAEIQSSGQGSVDEIDNILTRLKELGDKEDEAGHGISANVEELDEVEDAKEMDLADRLSGLDIDALPEEALWNLLSSQEKETFSNLLKCGTVGALVPLWRPWWEQHQDQAVLEVLEEVGEPGGDEAAGQDEKGTRDETDNKHKQKGQLPNDEDAACSSSVNRDDKSLIGVLADIVVKDSKIGVETQGELVKEPGQNKAMVQHRKKVKAKTKATHLDSSVPPVNTRIPPLSSLSSNTSPLVRYGLVNTLISYTFTLRLFNGDVESDLTQEFCQVLLTVSESLSSSRVFNSLQEALQGGEAAIIAGGYLDREDPCALARAMESVAHILTGRSRQDAVGYCLAALSQLRTLLSQARAALPKEGHERDVRKKCFLAGKKCEFFQAWVSENTQEVRNLAAGVWREHERRMNERRALVKEKQKVEESWKKRSGKAKFVLIEEIK